MTPVHATNMSVATEFMAEALMAALGTDSPTVALDFETQAIERFSKSKDRNDDSPITAQDMEGLPGMTRGHEAMVARVMDAMLATQDMADEVAGGKPVSFSTMARFKSDIRAIEEMALPPGVMDRREITRPLSDAQLLAVTDDRELALSDLKTARAKRSKQR